MIFRLSFLRWSQDLACLKLLLFLSCIVLSCISRIRRVDSTSYARSRGISKPSPTPNLHSISARSIPSHLSARLPQLRFGPLQLELPCDIIGPDQDLRGLSPLLPVSGAIAPAGQVEMLCANSSTSFEGLKGSRRPSC